MNLNSPNDDLKEILKHFNRITGLRMTVFDTEKKIIAEYPSSHCSFCSYINSFPYGKTECEKSNWHAFSICEQKQQAYIYKCHLGLLEVVLPLVQNDKVIGFAMFGQITNEKNSDEIKNRLIEFSESVDIDFETAIKYSSNIKYHSPNLINAEINILQICCTYILSQHLVPYKKTLYDKIMDYIQNTDLKNIKITTLCKKLNVSRTLVYTTFSKHNSIGIAQYIRDLKIKKAILLLNDGQLSIKEIAYETGFIDSNHFIKVFKSYYDITPKEYQKQNN